MRKILLYILISFIYPIDYYVSTIGDSLNQGTFDSPFLYIQQAVNVMEAGDICYIRQGVYHDNIILDNKDGTLANPIIFTSYNNERVVMDGSVSIDSVWEPYSDNI